MIGQNWNRDLMEHILSLLQFLQEKGVPVDQSAGIETASLLPEDPALWVAYEMVRFMDQIPGGFLIYRADGEELIVYGNSGLMRIFRCDTWEQFQTLVQGSFRGLVHPEDLDEVEESIKRQIADSQYDLDYVEYRIIRRDGTIGWIEDYGHFIHVDSVGDFFYVFLGDATEKLERRLNEELQREILQKQILAEALENANLAIEAKNEFLSNMSHNMRTPMNAIFGFAALAKLKTEDPELLDCIERVERSGRQLMDMIEKVLEVSWAGAKGQETEKECSLCQIALEVCDLFTPQAVDKKLELKLDCSGVEHSFVQADRERLKQLITNLVSNAITYTGPGGRVSVSLTEGNMDYSGRRSYRIAVEDTGVGMSKEFQSRLFEPFARERDTTHSGVNGMGLGLTIVKYIVDRMGGAVRVDSAPGLGSTFTVVLPLKTYDAHPAEPEVWTGPQEQASGQRILLVEDNEFNREIEMELLQNSGFVVDTAEDGSIAVEKVKQSKGYDLILMDIQMPVMDGWTASQLIRQLDDPKLASIPIIALSANALAQDMRRSIESGMNAHLTKPINIPRLLEEIRRTARKTGQNG